MTAQRLLFPLFLGLCALFTACVTPQSSLSLGGLVPSATVASNDGFSLEKETDVPEDAQPTATPTLALVSPHSPSEPTRLHIQPTAQHTTHLQLTPLTLGEALLFTQHPKTELPGARFELTEETSLDLSQIARYSSLIALYAQTFSPQGEVVDTHHELLQLSPLLAHTSTQGDTLTLTLVDRFSANPITGADVELLNADGKHIARGTTNRKGRLELAAPTASKALLGTAHVLSIRSGQHLAIVVL